MNPAPCPHERWERIGENVRGDMWICLSCGKIEYREPAYPGTEEILRRRDADTRAMLLEQMDEATDRQLDETIRWSEDPPVVARAEQLLTERMFRRL